MSFDSLGLCAPLCRTLADLGYAEPTPIQAAAIPVVLSGKDVLAGAQTGTGKTAGFALPLLQRFLEKPAHSGGGPRPVRALVLVPTRELAAQVDESFRTYGVGTGVRSTAIFGGVNMTPQIQALRRGVDVLVATPGRLLDHLSQRTFNLSQLEVLVLDEADRMLDMGFIRDIKRILALLPTQRQNLLFSATFSNEIRALASEMLDNPVSVDVAPRNQESALVEQVVFACPKDYKRDLLLWLIAEEPVRQALVFTRTKHGADRLCKQLQKGGVAAAAIHGDRSQPQRTRALADFKSGAVSILVATDIAARGLDIEQLPHVVNYELPHVPEDYVHRIGRTGRAGCPGKAISLVCDDESDQRRGIERLLGRPLERGKAEGFLTAEGHPLPEPSADTVPAAKSTSSRRQSQGGRGGRPQGNSPRNPQWVSSSPDGPRPSSASSAGAPAPKLASPGAGTVVPGHGRSSGRRNSPRSTPSDSGRGMSRSENAASSHQRQGGDRNQPDPGGRPNRSDTGASSGASLSPRQNGDRNRGFDTRGNTPRPNRPTASDPRERGFWRDF